MLFTLSPFHSDFPPLHILLVTHCWQSVERNFELSSLLIVIVSSCGDAAMEFFCPKLSSVFMCGYHYLMSTVF